MKAYSSIQIPEDYLDFLREIMGVAFVIEDYPTFEFWSIEDILKQKRDFPCIESALPDSLLIGTDLGDFLMFYGEGNELYGLYFVESLGAYPLFFSTYFSSSSYSLFTWINNSSFPLVLSG